MVPERGVSSAHVFAAIAIVVIFITIIIPPQPKTVLCILDPFPFPSFPLHFHTSGPLLQLLPPPGMFPLTSAPVKMLAILLDSAQIPASHSPTLSRLESTAPSSDLSDHMTYLFP